MRVPRIPATGWTHGLLTGLLLAGLLVVSAPARAASYDFPSAMPPGCSGSNGSYSCGPLSLQAADTVTISGTRPATVTVNGDLALNGAKVNQGGSVSDLNLVVQGLLTPGYRAVVNANVVAGEVTDSNGEVVFGGSIRTTDRAVTLGYRTVVSGDITTVSDNVELGDEATVHGRINASRAVRTAFRSTVNGSITAGDNISIGQENTVAGSISVSGSLSISIGFGSRVSGNVTSGSGTIDIAQAAVVNACVQVTDGSDPIRLGYQAQVAAVCCGAAGSCGGNSCVQNNSTYALPPACAAPPPPVLYLTGNGVPVASLTTTVPTGALRNFDPGRDSAAGLLLGRGASGVGESDGTKIQRWVSGTGGITLSGTVDLVLWSAMDRFRTDKAGGLTAFLRDCNAARSSCTALATASLTRSPWHGSATWVERTLSFGSLSRTISADRVLELSVIVNGSSDDDMMLAYDSASHPSRLTNATAAPPPSGPARISIEHASGTGLTCTPSTVTLRACQNADCSQPFTGGVTGTLGTSGGTVVWPGGAGFSIASGSSSTTVNLQATTTTPVLLGVASSTPAASNAATCNFGSPSCTFTAAEAGFRFDVPHHRSDLSQSLLVRAVRKSDNSLDCVPAFVNLTRSVNFVCGYTNPTTGNLPVRVGGNALNASGSAAAACDSGGRSTSLTFNASGIATTTVQYADAGQMTLTATYTGSAGTGDTGLLMSGSDSFVAAPERFDFSGITAGPIRAGSSFAATVTARNANGAATPNFGRETSAETLFTGWARLQPTGSGAANGSFSGSFGSFSGGAASAGNLAWTEVGRGDLVVRNTNASGYLGSSLLAYGSSAGTVVACANEGSSCVLPGGSTATVYYGERGSWFAKAGQTGTVACNSGNFGGDPLLGVVKKCLYVATGATNGSVGDFIPHRFTVATTNACGSFSYAGQPMPTTVTARNAAGNATVNFNGTATTTPVFAQAVTLTDANGLGLGTLAGASIAAAAFTAGVASATPSYSFTTKTTAPQSLVLRATNGGSGAALISSQGYTEPTLPLRSGRLRLANAFGKAGAALLVPVVAEHWGGSAWQINSADSCTALAGASVALSNPRGAGGAASTATSSAGALAISSGSGSISLAAPSPAGSSLSLDLAINLGSTGTDQSCNPSRPASTGAGLPWLRAQNGSCASTADRDPAARASFGIFAPETRKTVHVRDLY